MRQEGFVSRDQFLPSATLPDSYREAAPSKTHTATQIHLPVSSPPDPPVWLTYTPDKAGASTGKCYATHLTEVTAIWHCWKIRLGQKQKFLWDLFPNLGGYIWMDSLWYERKVMWPPREIWLASTLSMYLMRGITKETSCFWPRPTFSHPLHFSPLNDLSTS